MNAATLPSLDPRGQQLLDALHSALGSAAGGPLQQAAEQLCRHFRQRAPAPERLALAPWQERKAKELLASAVEGQQRVAEVAQQCGLSRSHFTRAFKRATGLSPQAWSLEARLERARQLLQGSRLPISHISQECGFADQSHFCRSFSRAAGMSPLQWRRALPEVARV
ncbi:helix-turn-helix domain-containing protein [Pseudomonas sp. NPDC007930]|uniref:helix-turn-helix domain-containing protein n=1 Tax=Pseudomonas sp. NPDC007930 TaxID=3364417 RepID=UPI0036E8378A